MSFASDMEAYAKKAGLSLNQTVISVALELYGSVIKDTPADTGRARGNWHAEINQAEENIFEFAGGGAAAIPFALSHCNQAIEKMYGHRWILTNNLPYIQPLETLDSMVRGTVLEFNRAIEVAVKGLK